MNNNHTGVYAQDSWCEEYDEECLNPGPWYDSHKVIEWDMFPGCEITVYYKWRQCEYTPGNHVTQWKLVRLFVDVKDGACTSLINYITNNRTGITKAKLKEFKLAAIRTVSLLVFIDWYNTAPQWAKDMVECGQGAHHKVMYFQKACTKQCFATYDIGGEVWHTLIEVDCHDHIYTECCGITYHYCMENGVPQITSTTTGHYSNCYFAPWPDPSGCPEDATDLEILWCQDNCLED